MCQLQNNLEYGPITVRLQEKKNRTKDMLHVSICPRITISPIAKDLRANWEQ